MAVIVDELPHAAFTMLRNCWLRDARISYKAKGLLGYLRSHAAGYRCSQAQMVRESDDGRAAVRAALDELEAAGYLERLTVRGDAGRYAETDYRMRDPFDSEGRVRKTEPSAVLNAQETAPGPKIAHGTGSTVSDYPTPEIAPIEEQREETTPVPTGQASSDDDGRHLRAVDGPTLNQRANVLTREHYEASNGMVPFAGVLQIVRKALDRGGYDDDRVRKALALLRENARPITLQTLHAALETPDVFTGGRRGRPPTAPYRNPDPRTDPDAFTGAF